GRSPLAAAGLAPRSRDEVIQGEAPAAFDGLAADLLNLLLFLRGDQLVEDPGEVLVHRGARGSRVACPERVENHLVLVDARLAVRLADRLGGLPDGRRV